MASVRGHAGLGSALCACVHTRVCACELRVHRAQPGLQLDVPRPLRGRIRGAHPALPAGTTQDRAPLTPTSRRHPIALVGPRLCPPAPPQAQHSPLGQRQPGSQRSSSPQAMPSCRSSQRRGQRLAQGTSAMPGGQPAPGRGAPISTAPGTPSPSPSPSSPAPYRRAGGCRAAGGAALPGSAAPRSWGGDGCRSGSARRGPPRTSCHSGTRGSRPTRHRPLPRVGGTRGWASHPGAQPGPGKAPGVLGTLPGVLGSPLPPLQAWRLQKRRCTYALRMPGHQRPPVPGGL